MSETLHREFTITQEQVNRYAEVSDDHNPLHLDPDFARERGFSGTIAHGLLTLGLVSAALAEWLGDSWAKGGRLDARFSAPVVVGSVMHLDVTRADGGSEEEYRAEARVGDVVVIRATARMGGER